MLIIWWIGVNLRKQSGRIQSKMADITSILQETISGVKIVKAFGMEEYENRKFISETKNYFKMILRIVRVRNISSPLTEFLSVVIGVFIIYYGGVMVLQENTLKASEFPGLSLCYLSIDAPIKELSSVSNRIQESSAAGDKFLKYLIQNQISAIVWKFRIA
ncbi:MAG: ABC transporter transmembrane domain-containing protein [Ignavibacteriales bacterium]|nr:ABC transporter transmembrane domain-containing protein [Ignavibacteriales bacterium]